MPPRATKRSPRVAAAAAGASASARSEFVRPKTANQAVAEAIRRDISSGRFPPGSWIVQESLVEMYGVSDFLGLGRPGRETAGVSPGAIDSRARRFKFGSRSGAEKMAPEITPRNDRDHDAILENCSPAFGFPSRSG